MNDEQRLAICEVCKNKDFSPKLGVVCALTSKRPAFKEVCNDFVADPKMIARKNRAAESHGNVSNNGERNVVVTGASPSPWRIILMVIIGIIVLLRILSRCDRMMN